MNIAPHAPQCSFLETGDITNCVSVVAILYTIDNMANAEEDQELTRLISEAASIDEEGVKMEADMQALLPENKSYYTYKGSLTTPPCTETLLWHVMSTPMKVSEATMQKIQDSVVAVNPDNKFNTRLV